MKIRLCSFQFLFGINLSGEGCALKDKNRGIASIFKCGGSRSPKAVRSVISITVNEVALKIDTVKDQGVRGGFWNPWNPPLATPLKAILIS